MLYTVTLKGVRFALLASVLFFCQIYFLSVRAQITPVAVDVKNDPVIKPEDIKAWRKTKLANPEEIALSVGIKNHTDNPYPMGPHFWYDVRIEYNNSCFVRFLDSQKETYELVTSRLTPEDKGFGVFLTHRSPCGVCSSLQDLAVYASKRDLTTPVRICAMIPVASPKRQCLRNIGFSEGCMWIWFWNSVNTAKRKSQGGCFGTCIRNLGRRNNIPSGSYNPCEPYDESSELTLGSFNTEKSQFKSMPVERRRTGFLSRKTTSFMTIKKRKQKGYCKNTINEEPACDPVQYENGPYRLNPCLQCDECRSGPLFKKVAGRTRRNSGIRSAIERPGFKPLGHNYFSIRNEL